MAGFFAGAILHMAFFRDSGLHLPLFFLMPIAGAYLLPLAFSSISPATCPSCGQASALARAGQLNIYGCRGCGASSDSLLALQTELMADQADPVKWQKSESRLLWIALVAGLVAIGISAWLGADSIELLRKGVVTEGRVARVGQTVTYDSQTRHVAFVDYRVGKGAMTLERSWSMEAGSRCMWPCYHPGDAVKVIYLPDEPSRAKIHSLPEHLFGPSLIGLVGLLFAGFGFGMLRRRARAA